MLHNYFVIAIRNLSRHKVHGLINLIGLSLGMACCILLFFLIRHEWSYDRFHEKADRIYRVTLPYKAPDGTVNFQNMTTPEFTPQFAAEFPVIEAATRYVTGNVDFEVGNEYFRQLLTEVDADFFEMFTFPVVAGDAVEALGEPGSMVVTTEVAEAWFGVKPGSYRDALGQTAALTRDGVTHTFTVRAVTEDPPANSSLDYEVAISFENYERFRIGGNNWGGRASTYILLPAGADPSEFEVSVVDWVDHITANYQQGLRDNGYLAEATDPDVFRLALQPLTQLHRQPDVWVPYEASPLDPVYLYILAGIGFLVLIIACINFTTLTIGRSNTRQREVGMRKVLGARRRQLLAQFWGETIVMTVASLVVAVLLAWLALPLFSEMSDTELSFGALAPIQLIAILVVFVLLVGLVAGSYPAAVLSGFSPVAVLKGTAVGGSRHAITRGLVVLQYTISIGLMIGTLIMADQLSYIAKKDLGYDKDLVMVVHTQQVPRADADVVIDRMRSRLLADRRIEAVAPTGHTFNRGSDRNTWTDENGITRQAYNFGVSFDYIDLMDMEVVAGRNFSRDFPADSTRSVLVNETLVREFELKDPVGKELTNWLSFIYEESPVIIGVVKDFHFLSLREEIQPVVMNMHPDYYNYFRALLVRIRPDNLNGAVEAVEQAWVDILPGRPFTYSFLDEDLARAYADDQRWTAIVRYSAILAILIACLGMFGLATISVTRRTKEIGVRKVLGASVPGLLRLVAKEFAWLVVAASVLAFPLAYYAMNEWLSSFASHVDIDIGTFVLAAALALAVALLTISFHAVRAATADPVRALRYE